MTTNSNSPETVSGTNAGRHNTQEDGIMTTRQMTRTLLAIAAVLFTSTLWAADITWNNTVGDDEWNTGDTNFTDGSSNVAFTSGDIVNFLDTAPGSVFIGAGGTAADVDPASTTINSASNYSFSGGDITTGSIAKQGIGDATFSDDASYSFTGGASITGGALHYQFTNTSNAVTSMQFGNGGNISVDGASTEFHFEYAGYEYNSGASQLRDINVTLNNSFVISNGGTLSFVPGSKKRIGLTVNGNLDLQSDLSIDTGDGTATSSSTTEQLNWSGTITLTGGDRTLSFEDTTLGNAGFTTNYNSVNDFSGAAIDGGGTRSLTLDFPVNAQRLRLPETGTDLNIVDLTFDNDVGVRALEGDDYFATMRANGGQVNVQSGGTFRLEGGTFDLDSTDYNFSPGSNLTLQPGSTTHRPVLSGGLIVGDGGPVPTVIMASTADRNDSGASVQGDLTVANGGTLHMTGSQQWSALDNGDITLLGGSTLLTTYNHTGNGGRTLSVGSNTGSERLRLGDGSAATHETITITGLNSHASTGSFGIGATVEDDGNVTLRYESVGTGATLWFSPGWTNPSIARHSANDYKPIEKVFQGGSAATVFAPSTDNAGIQALGPISGTVFTAVSPITLETAGTVEFRNTGTKGSVAALGPLAVDGAGGSFLITASGTVRASTISVTNGAAIGGTGTFDATSVSVAGSTITPGTSPGTLNFTGTVSMDDTSTLLIDLASDSVFDVLNVTGSATIDGVLDILLAPGYLPSKGQTFDILTASSISGSMTINSAFPDYIDYEIVNGGTTLQVISTIPEPTAFVALLLGVSAVAFRRTRAVKAPAMI